MLTLLGIVVPALLLFEAVRRWITPVPRRFAWVFLALTLAFLHGAVFTSKLPVPADEVARGYPWRGLFGDVQAKNPLTNDIVRQFLPWMQAAREELFRFHAPLWNRYSFSGTPLLGNAQSAPYSPLFLATLFVPLPKQVVAMAGLKIFVALLFGFLFLKREGASDAAACFAAIAFAFSVMMTVFLYYSASAVIAFLPAMSFALLHVIDRPSKSSVVFVALVMATLMANGHPESVLHIAIGAACILGIELALASDRREWLRRARWMVVGVVVGLALSAPAWVPVAELVPLSARYAAVRNAPPQRLPLTAAWAILTPNGFGNPARHNWNWLGNYSTVAVSYAGLLVLTLAIAALGMRGAARERARLAVALVLFLAAMGWGIAVPFTNFVANDKLRFVSIFLVAAVGAKAIGEAKWKAALAGLPLAALVAYVYHARVTVMRPVDLAGAAVVILYLLLPRVAAPLLCAAELLALNAGFNALVDTKYDAPRLPIVEALRAHAPAEPFRVAGLDWAFLPNAAARYGLQDVRGSDPMELESYAAWFRRFSVREPGTDVARVVDANAPQLDRLGVRFLIAQPSVALGGKWRAIYHGADGVLFANGQAQPLFPGAEEVREERPGRYRMRVATARRIETSIPAAPGWRVRGGRVVRGAGPFLAFDAAPGEIRVEYRPMSYTVAVVVAFLAVVGLAWNRPLGGGVMPGPDAETSSLKTSR